MKFDLQTGNLNGNNSHSKSMATEGEGDAKNPGSPKRSFAEVLRNRNGKEAKTQNNEEDPIPLKHSTMNPRVEGGNVVIQGTNNE